MKSTIYNAKTFWPAFLNDLANAEGHVVIQSPFLSYPRINELVPHFQRLTKRGVAICALVQQPKVHKYQREPDIDLEEFCKPKAFKDLCIMLQNLNVHVTLINEIHAKLATIDGKYMWEGSLNMLSHTNAKEHMRRWDDRNELEAVVKLQELESCRHCLENRKRFSLGSGDNERLDQLGALLSYHRSCQNMSQRDLANATGTSRQRISEIEHGINTKALTLLTITDQLKLDALLVPAHKVSAVCNLLCKEHQ